MPYLSIYFTVLHCSKSSLISLNRHLTKGNYHSIFIRSTSTKDIVLCFLIFSVRLIPLLTGIVILISKVVSVNEEANENIMQTAFHCVFIFGVGYMTIAQLTFLLNSNNICTLMNKMVQMEEMTLKRKLIYFSTLRPIKQGRKNPKFASIAKIFPTLIPTP